MSKSWRYNELDEMDWEYKNGCYDEPCGDECWDEACAQFLHANAPELEPVEDNETGQGIFGNELNHDQRAKNEPSGCISNGSIFGHGEKDQILDAVFNMLAPFKDYHFEFKFFEAK